LEASLKNIHTAVQSYIEFNSFSNLQKFDDESDSLGVLPIYTVETCGLALYGQKAIWIPSFNALITRQHCMKAEFLRL
jgi:hypothetical protein